MRSTQRTLVRAVAACLAATVALAGCGSGDDTRTQDTSGDTSGAEPAGDVEQDDLDGATYQATEVLENDEPHRQIEPSDVGLSFDGAEMGINAGCNHLFGTPSVEDGRLEVTNVGGTEMACGGDFDRDAWITDLLEGGVDLELDGQTLTLSGQNTEIVLTEQQEDEPGGPEELTGVTWTLESIYPESASGPDDSVSSVPGDVTATIEFNDDGEVGVETGCNTGGGSAEITAEAVTFSEPVIATQIACEGPEGEADQAMKDVLQGELTYTVQDDTLRLEGPNGGLGFTAG
ncbi:MAG TPA: META domain-containing protein [Jiangellaceae bacterium]|nr:META domain-containing protein [Jiangellaceae bacterium]